MGTIEDGKDGDLVMYDTTHATRNTRHALTHMRGMCGVCVECGGMPVSWDRHPLQVDAQAFKVLIEGHLAADNSAFASAVVPPPPAGNATLQPTGPSACQNVRPHTRTTRRR